MDTDILKSKLQQKILKNINDTFLLEFLINYTYEGDDQENPEEDENNFYPYVDYGRGKPEEDKPKPNNTPTPVIVPAIEVPEQVPEQVPQRRVLRQVQQVPQQVPQRVPQRVPEQVPDPFPFLPLFPLTIPTTPPATQPIPSTLPPRELPLPRQIPTTPPAIQPIPSTLPPEELPPRPQSPPSDPRPRPSTPLSPRTSPPGLPPATRPHPTPSPKPTIPTAKPSNVNVMLAKDVQEKLLNTTRQKITSRLIAREAAQGGAKFLLKKVPGLSVLAGLALASPALAQGDWEQAGYEVSSGIAGTVPGFGTAASIGIDALAFKRNLDKLDNMTLEELQKLSDELDTEETSEKAAEKTKTQEVVQHKPTDPVRFTPGKI